ncbi:MAG: flagellar export chaperone FlgN [Desulfovibrionales bacterium]
MNNYLLTTLSRLNKGFVLLDVLLREEFSALKGHDTKKIAAVEFSVQELLQQLMREKQILSRNIRESGFDSLNEWLHKNPEEEKTAKIWERTKEKEQQAAVQGAKNNKLANALAEQSNMLLGFFYDQLSVEQEDVYSSRATFARRRKDAGIIRGRL